MRFWPRSARKILTYCAYVQCRLRRLKDQARRKGEPGRMLPRRRSDSGGSCDRRSWMLASSARWWGNSWKKRGALLANFAVRASSSALDGVSSWTISSRSGAAWRERPRGNSGATSYVWCPSSEVKGCSSKGRGWCTTACVVWAEAVRMKQN